MRKSTGEECESYSCEEHPETHDKFIGYIHNLTMGSKTTSKERDRTQDSRMYGVHVYF